MAALNAHGVGFWGPVRLRKGLVNGIIPKPSMHNPAAQLARAQGRIKLNLARAQARGMHAVVVSEENIIGTMRHNFASASLYPSAGDRVARFASAFGGVHTLALGIRALDSYWTSAMTYAVPKGQPVASPSKIERIAAQRRTWRDVIEEIAKAVPETRIIVAPYERVAARPDALLGHMLDLELPASDQIIWRNARPSLAALLQLPLLPHERRQIMASNDGNRWQPFTAAERAMMREAYHDDIFWLRAGADGLATYIEDPKTGQAGIHLPPFLAQRGQDNDQGYRLARPG